MSFKSIALPIAGIHSPKLKQAHDYWLGRRGNRTMPAREDIHPEEIAPILGNILLVDVTYDPLDFRYRLFGSAIAEAHGADYGGMSVRDLEPDGFNDLIWEQYSEVVESRTPLVHQVVYDTPKKLLSYERITMPLSSDDDTIDMLFAVSEYEKRFWQGIEAEETTAGSADRYGATQ